MGSNRDPRHEVTGELGAATSCPPSSGGAGRRRTPVMEQRAVLRPYLHEFDVYMRKYTALHEGYRRKRRAQGLSNFVYGRYADDWVILCNGTRAQAEEMKGEVYDFLQSELHLTLFPQD